MSSSDIKMASKRMKTKKQIPEKKLQAFSIGCMGKRGLSKKEQDEQRKKEEDEAAAHAFQEFVETFQETPNKANKVWIKAGTYDAGARKEDTKDKGKLYKPTSRISEMHEKTSAEKAQEYARLLLSNDRKPDRLGKKKEKDKKKSNLELFKEELKMIQEEREERHKYKGAIKSSISTAQTLVEADKDQNYLKDGGFGDMGSFDNGDPTTTNLYLGNLNPKITEQELMAVFGRYGPLASIKIMWPRSDEEKARRRNCGFVAFMNRQDGERALKNLNGRNVLNCEMKLGWGKAVPIPTHPIFIPSSLKELTMPPPPSGLPFNAQLSKADSESLDISTLKFNDLYMSDPEMKEKVNKILYKAVVKVVMPTDRSLLVVIHRMVEFVIREGPMFEAMIMNREMNNPLFRFLFDNNSPAHIYYRWKLFSLLQGEQQKEWSTMEFRMFKGGSIWKPPPMNVYTQGMPEEQIFGDEINKGSLSITQRDRLEELLRYVNPERSRIAKAMVFCMEHSDAAEEICDCIAESLANDTTTIPKKLGRFYLVSDILANCAAKILNASFYRRAFESRLISIFSYMNLTYKNMESRLKAESFKNRVMLVTRAWEEWAIFPQDFIHKCQNTFLGIVQPEEKDDQVSPDEDVDGAPLSSGEAEEDLDGVPLDGAALLKGALLRGLPQVQSSPNINKTSRIDTDISETGDDIDGTPLDNKLIKSGGFIPSKWETVDPVQVEAQAITTSKWDTLEQLPHKSVSPSPPLLSKSVSNVSNDSEDESLWSSNDQNDARDLDEERRLKLREIEVKSMQYQDELECGSRTLKSGWSIQQQVEHYRRKLIRKSDKETREKDYDDKSPSPEKEKRIKSERKDKTKRSDSSEKDHSSRHRSRSPHSSKKKRSPSVTSRSNKRRSSNSPDSQSPIRKHHRSSVSPDRKYYQSSPGSSRKHQYNNLSPLRSKYSRVPTPSPPRTSKYDSPYSKRSISPTPTKSSRYNNSVSPPTHYRSSKHSSPPRTKHRVRSPSPKRHRHSPSPTRSTSSKHSHSHRDREEGSSRKHKHKYKH